MEDKILLVYATRCGSTEEIARYIGKELSSLGVPVDILPAKKDIDIAGYKAVIVGSAVRIGKCMEEAVEFVTSRRKELIKLPVAYFVVCLTMKDDTEENRVKTFDFLKLLSDTVEPVKVGLFAGSVDYKKFSLPLRLMAKSVKIPEGDYRDWDKIKEWTLSLKQTLTK